MLIKKNQSEALQKALSYCAQHSPFYQNWTAWQDAIATNDFFQIPFTTKQQFAEQNEAFRAIPKSKIAEFVTTSGTTGKPVTLYLSKHDLERLAKNEADSLQLTGATSEDVFQLMTTIDKQFMAGLAYYLGVQKMDAGMIRVGPGVLNMQLNAILNYHPTYLIAVPSFIPRLIEYAEAKNINLNDTSIKAIVCIGEPIRDLHFELNQLGKKITDRWNVALFSTYASTEMATAFTECPQHQGYHTNEDLIYLEVILEDDKHAQEGELGEIVVTTLGVEGTPLVRFKTGDLAHVYYAKCSCGRDTTRLSSIVGRKNQMIKFKGTTLFPNSIFAALNSIEEIGLYQVEVNTQSTEHQLTILLSEKSRNEDLIEKIRTSCKENLRVIPEIEFIADHQLKSTVFNEDKRKPELIRFI